MTTISDALLQEEDDYIKRADVLRLIDKAFGWPPSSRGTVLTQLASGIAALRAQAQPGHAPNCRALHVNESECNCGFASAQAQPGEDVLQLARELVEWAESVPRTPDEDFPEMLAVRDNTVKVCRALLRAQSMGGSSVPHRGAGDTAANANGPRVGESPAAGESPAQSMNMTPTAVAGSPSALSERPASSELLEATATPVQSAPWQRADGNYTWQGAAPAPCVSCSDEQQCAAYQRGVIAGKRSAAPAQEPVAWQIKVAGVWAAVPHEPEWEPGIEARPLYAAPQPAPAQEPRAWEHWSLTEPCYLQGIYPKKRLSFHHVPLYAAPPPDEARDLLREAGFSDMTPDLGRRIRAYLEKHK